MAGSIKYFVYTSDNGNDYAIRLDESNTEAIMGDTGDYTDATTTTVEVPRNIKPRRVTYASGDRTVTRSIVVLTNAVYTNILNGSASQTIDVNVEGTTYTLGFLGGRGEEFRRPTPADTGQTDGDAT